MHTARMPINTTNALSADPSLAILIGDSPLLILIATYLSFFGHFSSLQGDIVAPWLLACELVIKGTLRDDLTDAGLNALTSQVVVANL